jgi:hypothetical protein
MAKKQNDFLTVASNNQKLDLNKISSTSTNPQW